MTSSLATGIKDKDMVQVNSIRFPLTTNLGVYINSLGDIYMMNYDKN